MVLFVPGLSAPATTPRWALLAAVVPAVAMFTECRRFTVAHGLGAAFLTWAAFSLLWTPNIWDGLDALWKLALIAGLFHIGAELPSLRPVYIGAALGLSVSSLLAVMQLFGLELVDRIEGETGMAAGLFMNKNYLAEPAALVLIGLLGGMHHIKRDAHFWSKIKVLWPIPLVLPAVVLPGARGAALALAVAAAAWLWPRSRLAVVLITGAAGGALFALASPNNSIPDRLIIWAATLDGMTWLGNGIGSFYTLFPSHAPGWDFLASRPVHAHNDWLEIAYETGLPGALLLGLLVCTAIYRRTDVNGSAYVMLALITEGCFGFPLHFPATVFLGALVAGQLCRDGPALRDVLDRGGMALCDGLERVAVRLGSRPARRHRRGGVPARPPA